MWNSSQWDSYLFEIGKSLEAEDVKVILINLNSLLCLSEESWRSPIHLEIMRWIHDITQIQWNSLKFGGKNVWEQKPAVLKEKYKNVCWSTVIEKSKY